MNHILDKAIRDCMDHNAKRMLGVSERLDEADEFEVKMGKLADDMEEFVRSFVQDEPLGNIHGFPREQIEGWIERIRGM